MLPQYVLITPARNEAQFIRLTLQSVVSQTVRPLKWVVVSDGSTDGTDEIVREFADKYRWIELVRAPERRERNFAGKVHAFYVGYERVRNLDYDVIGSLDGDMSFGSDYFAFLLGKLAENSRLGLVGSRFKDAGTNETYDYRFVNIEHVSGACQLFRRQCFEEIGGYVPVKGGGIDYIAVVSSRMKGWQTRTFPEMCSIHHRNMGTAQHGVLKSRFKYGVKDYCLGNHPVWEIFRIAYQMTRRPVIIGGLLMFFGYLWGLIRRSERPISRDLIAFIQSEQMHRLGRRLAVFGSHREKVLSA